MGKTCAGSIKRKHKQEEILVIGETGILARLFLPEQVWHFPGQIKKVVGEVSHNPEAIEEYLKTGNK
jgi:hypothetical protein